MPQCPEQIGEAIHAGVHSIKRGQGVVVVRLVEINALLQMRSGRNQLSSPKRSSPHSKVGNQEKWWVLSALG
jgi:hypothetical protein